MRRGRLFLGRRRRSTILLFGRRTTSGNEFLSKGTVTSSASVLETIMSFSVSALLGREGLDKCTDRLMMLSESSHGGIKTRSAVRDTNAFRMIGQLDPIGVTSFGCPFYLCFNHFFSNLTKETERMAGDYIFYIFYTLVFLST